MLFIGVTISILTYPFDNFNYGFRGVVSDLLNNERLDDNVEMIKWGDHFIFELFISILIRMF